MKKQAFILTVLLGMILQPGLHARCENLSTQRDPKINVGLKAGFNSSMFFIDHFSLGSRNLQDIRNNYKVGYQTAFFCRFNLKSHHFIQTELSYSNSKGSISIADEEDNIGLLADDALVKTELHTFDIPLLYGYKFVDAYPYGMAFFIGPKASYVWDKHSQSTYTGFYQQDIRENMKKFCFSAVAGLAVNVSNIFFDFRYEVGLHDMIRGTVFDEQVTQSPYSQQQIILKRRQNILSFSIGVIF